MTRIAVGGFLHETNTFAPTKATYDDFVHGGGWPAMAPGADVLEDDAQYQCRTGRLCRGRQIATGWELVPTISCARQSFRACHQGCVRAHRQGDGRRHRGGRPARCRLSRSARRHGVRTSRRRRRRDSRPRAPGDRQGPAAGGEPRPARQCHARRWSSTPMR